MSEKLCTLATNDKVYFYDKSIVIFFSGKRKVLSTSSYNGGYHEDFVAVYNYDGKQGSGMPCERCWQILTRGTCVLFLNVWLLIQKRLVV